MDKKTKSDIQPFTELFDELPDQIEANDEKRMDKLRQQRRLGTKKGDLEVAQMKEDEERMDEYFAKLDAKKEMEPEKFAAREFLNSMRGWYIMSQALHVAIKAMKEVPAPHTERSNIKDMEWLQNMLFNFPFKSMEAEEELRARLLEAEERNAS